MDLPARLAEHLDATGLIPAGSAVLVAVSGGGDSVALLRLLAALAPGRSWRLEVACVDHRTRPETANEARFVASLAGSLGLPAGTLALETPSAASPSPSEDVLRRGRRAALAAAMGEVGADLVALGHQADDVVETVVMRLLRGAGIDGLGGIPRRHGPFVRPLLGFRRAELRAWLAASGATWMDDPTNADARRLRAAVRTRLLPALRAVAPGIDEGLLGLAHAVADLRGALDGWDAGWLERHAVVGGAGALELPLAPLRVEAAVSQGRLVRAAAERLGVARFRVGRACVEEVLAAVARDEPGAVVPLPGGLEAVRAAAGLGVRRCAGG